MGAEHDKLLYGKSGVKRLVGLEVGDTHAELFIQNHDGTVVSEFKPVRFWILSSKPLSKKFVKLKGSLHYQYGTQFSDRSEWSKLRSIWRNEDIYTIWNSEESLMVKDGYCFYQDMKLSEVSLMSFDIETTGLDPRDKDAKVLLISTTYRDHTGTLTNKLFAYDDYQNEQELIDAFCSYVREKDPSLLIGHNILSFDFVYLDGRASVNGTSLRLGRDESNVQFDSYQSRFRLDGTRNLEYNNVKVYGRELCDTFFLSMSFDVSKAFESYALKPLIKQLGFEKEGRQYYDAGSIRDHYKNPVEWEKIKAYAEADAEDPIKLFDMMAPLYFNMCPMIPKPFSEILLSASGSKINSMMVRAYLQDGHSLPKADETRKFAGALSFAVPGVYSNTFKIDLSSLYPSIMIEYEVYDDKKDPQGYLLQLVKTFRAKRLEYKRLAAETGDSYWQQLDTTAKGILNSFYGFCGASGLLFNSMDCAEFITAKGREILEYTITWASGQDPSKFIYNDEDGEVDETA